MTPRSVAIPKSWKTLNFGSLFAAFLYPALALALLITIVTLAAIFSPVSLSWWHIPLGLGVLALSVLVCNAGIGTMHRIMQHKAGELAPPAQVITMINLMIAMQGRVKDWVNYHSQHHRFSDGPGDPHNPSEGKLWAWTGWILFRDAKDMERPMPMWLKNHPIIVFMDGHYHLISVVIHFVVPAIIYLAVWALGGSLILTAILHACIILGRSLQFHATVYGINVLGHLKTPKWADYAMAMLTGGEAFHDHHHEEPQSALHLPRKGFFNRLFDYNGTILLAYEKLGWVRDMKIAQRFA